MPVTRDWEADAVVAAPPGGPDSDSESERPSRIPSRPGPAAVMGRPAAARGLGVGLGACKCSGQ